jgi:hypothetical protein
VAILFVSYLDHGRVFCINDLLVIFERIVVVVPPFH